MIATAIGALLSILLPLAAGSAIVSSLWPGSPRILQIAMGTGIGLGLAGATWTSALMISGSTVRSLIASESLLLILTTVLVLRRLRGSQNALIEKTSQTARGAEVAAVVLVVLFGLCTAAFLTDVSPHGGYDATAIWNSRARFFYLSERPLNVLPYLVSPDYPVVLPGLIARGWQYSRTNTVIVPIFLALFFTAASVLVLTSGLRLIVSRSTALLAGCMALGTPFFLDAGVSQYADIAMCFFITSSTVLLSIADATESGAMGLPLLAGLSAGFAAATKNEGNLFVLAMVLAQLCLLFWNRRWKADGIRLVRFLIGLVPGLLALAAFKAKSPMPNVLFSNMTLKTIVSAIGDEHRHFSVLKGFGRDLLFFGDWWINPLFFMILYAILLRIAQPGKRFSRHWQFPAAVLVIMICGYYGVYLFSPYPLDWHIQSSLPRLLVQLWPTALALWALVVTRKAAA